MKVTPDVLQAHFDALPILIEGVKLLPPEQRYKVLADWDAARNRGSSPPPRQQVELADAIEAATVDLVVHVPNTGFMEGDVDVRYISVIDPHKLVALLRGEE